MRMKSLLCVCLGIIFIVCIVVFAQTTHSKTFLKITGTYTNMKYNEEGGDVLGEELKIVATGGGYQGALQFAEGVPEDLIVVNIKLTGNEINFTIPDASTRAGQFSGTIANGTLRGRFHFKAGGAESVVLKKAKSYWD
jgi:hypothetical protein